MKLRITLLTAATLTAFSFAAHAAEKGTIMIMVNSLDNPYYASEAKGASEKAQALGYKTTVLSHGEDVKKQNELIDTAIGKKVQGIILDNADSTASVAAVEKAKKAGIPVVLINREIPVDDVALEQITHNNFQAAQQPDPGLPLSPASAFEPWREPSDQVSHRAAYGNVAQWEHGWWSCCCYRC